MAEKEMNGAIMRGYLRRGLVAVSFTETSLEDAEFRLYYGENGDIRCSFVVPWRVVENINLWQPTIGQYQYACEWLYRARASKAHDIIKWRRQGFHGVSLSDAEKVAKRDGI